MCHDEVAQERGEGHSLRHTTEDAKSDGKGKNGVGGRRGSRTDDTAVDECRNEVIYLVAKYRYD